MRSRADPLAVLWVCPECQARFRQQASLVEHQEAECHWDPTLQREGRTLVRKRDLDGLASSATVADEGTEQSFKEPTAAARAAEEAVQLLKRDLEAARSEKRAAIDAEAFSLAQVWKDRETDLASRLRAMEQAAESGGAEGTAERQASEAAAPADERSAAAQRVLAELEEARLAKRAAIEVEDFKVAMVWKEREKSLETNLARLSECQARAENCPHTPEHTPGLRSTERFSLGTPPVPLSVESFSLKTPRGMSCAEAN